MVNRVTLVGNLGADPEMRTAQSGTAIARLRVATQSREKDGENWTKATEWHAVVCFGKTAENVGRYLAKGRQVYIEGRLKTNKWQDKEGKDRYTTEIIAEVVQFLGSNPEAGSNPESGGNRDKLAGNTRYFNGGQGIPEGRVPQDDDIPF